MEHGEFVLSAEHPGGEIHQEVQLFLKVNRAEQFKAWALESELRLIIYKMRVILDLTFLERPN